MAKLHVLLGDLLIDEPNILVTRLHLQAITFLEPLQVLFTWMYTLHVPEFYIYKNLHNSSQNWIALFQYWAKICFEFPLNANKYYNGKFMCHQYDAMKSKQLRFLCSAPNFRLTLAYSKGFKFTIKGFI